VDKISCMTKEFHFVWTESRIISDQYDWDIPRLQAAGSEIRQLFW
jgi:hypothetical protein